MYAGVPRTEPACERSLSPLLRIVATTVSLAGDSRSAWAGCPSLGRTLARPQSITCTSPKDPTITLAGLRSRWITPRAWA